LLRENDLPVRVIEDQAHLDLLGPQDEPWLRVLLAELTRFEGRRRRELAERLVEPLACSAPYFKRRAATRTLFELWRRHETRPGLRSPALPASPLRPQLLRARLFGAAAGAGDEPTAAVVDRVAADVGATPAALMELLFADLPGERRVHAPDPIPTPIEAALQTNLAIAQAVVMRASHVALQIEGGVRPIVRLAKLRGLICSIGEPPQAGGPVLEISGPFSLFRHTLVYGRALAELIPHLAWCARFALNAQVALRGRLVRVAFESGAPIFPARAPVPFDSRLEERFARDLGRLAPDWDVIREPEPLRAGTSLIFPDFLVRHRLQPERRALVEIVGFWTPQYLTAKLEKLRQARLPELVLCVDADRGCAPTELPPELPVVIYRRRVDAAAVLREVERLTAGAARLRSSG
jgi:predicted nuclease of restriction endonuclease-like RecB superfamily